MSSSLRNGIRAGSVFAIVLIFLILIGFNNIYGTLIGKIYGANPKDAADTVTSLVIFLALIGIWAGISGAREVDPDTYPAALISGLVAGAVSGLVVGVMIYVIGSFYANGVDMRKYLSALSPAVVEQDLFNQPPLPGALMNFGVLALSGLFGGLLARGVGRSTWRRTIHARLRQSFANLAQVPWVSKLTSSSITRYAILFVVILVMFVLPRQWGSYWNYIIGTVGIYVLLGLGLNIIVGLAGQLVLGYVAFFAIGAYTMALLTAPEPHALNWNFWPALVVAIVLSALTGVLIGLPILRLRGDYLAIVTLGFGEIIRIMLKSDLLTNFTAGPRGVRNIAGPTLFGHSFSSDIDFVYLIFIAMIIMIFLTNRLMNSRAGRAWVAVREDETVAQAMGVNTFQSKLLALALGAAFAGLGGALFASRNQFTGPEDHALMVSINVLSLVIVGGMGSIPGVILGSFALKGLPEILRELENYRMLVFGGLLVAMMIMRPEGLWPATRPKYEAAETPPETTAETVNLPDGKVATHERNP
ncbi:MAG: hypothetical protein VB089_07450 [Anaerolineaceae bacterium]|nr:hypothetical protein [Anaerolineaceae bacterium]